MTDLEMMLTFAKSATPPAHLTVERFEAAAAELVQKRQLPDEDYHAAMARLFGRDEDLNALLLAADRVRRATAKRRRQVEDLESATGCRVPSRCDNGMAPEEIDRQVEGYAKALSKPGEAPAAALIRLSETDATMQLLLTAKRTAQPRDDIDLAPSADERELVALAEQAQVAAAGAPKQRAFLLYKASTTLLTQAGFAQMARLRAEGAAEKLSIADLVEAEDVAKRLIRAEVDRDPVEFDALDTADEVLDLASVLDTQKAHAARRLAKSLRAQEEPFLKAACGDDEACWVTDEKAIREKVGELGRRTKEAQFVGDVKEASRLHRMALALGNRLKALRHRESAPLRAPSEEHVENAQREVLRQP